MPRARLGGRSLCTKVPNVTEVPNRSTKLPSPPPNFFYDLNKQITERDRDFRELLKFATAEGANFNGVNWATTMSKLGRFRGADLYNLKKDERFPKLVQTISTAMTDKPLSEFGQGARSVANIAHALAKMRQPSSTIMNTIKNNAVFLVSSSSPQEIANTAWSFATIGVKAPGLFEEIEKQAPRIVKEGKPQEIANTAWAAATLGHSAPALFREIETRAEFLVSAGKPQEIANTAWAAATLSHPSPNLFKQIERQAEFLVDQGTPQAIANTAWAAASLGQRAPALFMEIEKHAGTRFCIVNSCRMSVDISHLAWAYGKLKFDAPAFFKAVDEESEALIKSGKTQEISNVALAFAETGNEPVKFFDCLEKRADEFARSATEQAICNTSWSLVTLGLASKNKALLQTLWKRAIEKHAQGSKFTSEALQVRRATRCCSKPIAQNTLFANMNSSPSFISPLLHLTLASLVQQLVQVDAHARASGVELVPVPQRLHKSMLKAAKLVDKSSSPFEDEYSALLAEAGFKHEREVQFLEGGWNWYGNFLAIDFACKKRKIAVEYDGAHHYLTEPKKGARAYWGRESGRTIAKRALMEKMGWKVVNVSYKDDIRLEKSPKEEVEKAGGMKELKIQFLRNRLKQVGVAL